eukprot:5304660-Pleurochrysis_carterae.AAC.1
MKKKLADEHVKKSAVKIRKRALREVNVSSEKPMSASAAKRTGTIGTDAKQTSIMAAMDKSQCSKVIDAALADLVFGGVAPLQEVCDVAEERARVVQATATPAFIRPTSGRDLPAVRTAKQPLRLAANMIKCMVVIDGWDDIEKNHLVNVLVGLVGSAKGFFFLRTKKRTSKNDHEDCESVANVIMQGMQTVCVLSVLQVCTDACSVMKAAWRIVENATHGSQLHTVAHTCSALSSRISQRSPPKPRLCARYVRPRTPPPARSSI